MALKRLMTAAQTPLGVAVWVGIGGVIRGLPVTSILVCGLVAAGGVTLVCGVATRLFDTPVGLDLLELWADFGPPLPRRLRRSRHAAQPASSNSDAGVRSVIVASRRARVTMR